MRTRTCSSISGTSFCSKIRTEASLGAVLRSDSLKAFLSMGQCKKRSALGYRLRTFSTMEGPVNSNLLAPPTKQTAILDLSNDRTALAEWGCKLIKSDKLLKIKERSETTELRCVEVKEETKNINERGTMTKKRRRQSSADHFLIIMLTFCGFFIISPLIHFPISSF